MLGPFRVYSMGGGGFKSLGSGFRVSSGSGFRSLGVEGLKALQVLGSRLKLSGERILGFSGGAWQGGCLLAWWVWQKHG